MKQSGLSFNWLPTKKDTNRQQVRFIPLETFKKKDTNAGLHTSCETVVRPPMGTIENMNQIMDSISEKSNKNSQTKLVSKEDLSHHESKNASETSLGIDREDCCCVQAVNRRKKGNMGPPIPPPRPSSTIEDSLVKQIPKETSIQGPNTSFDHDLKSHIPSPRKNKEVLPNLIVTYSKVGTGHHTEDTTPPSCGGMQSNTTFEDPLTPPPSYDSAISTPEKHFSIYSISNTATPSII